MDLYILLVTYNRTAHFRFVFFFFFFFFFFSLFFPFSFFMICRGGGGNWDASGKLSSKVILIPNLCIACKLVEAKNLELLFTINIHKRAVHVSIPWISRKICNPCYKYLKGIHIKKQVSWSFQTLLKSMILANAFYFSL